MKIIPLLLIFFTTTVCYKMYRSKSMASKRIPAQFISAENRGWRLSLFDNFSAPDVAEVEARTHQLDFDPICYSRAPRCEYIFWNKRTCDGWENTSGPIYQNLKNLNKCRWTIYNKYNWMDFDIAEGQGVNSFDASQVVVKDGHLHLKANKNPKWPANKNCKNKVWSGKYSNYSTDCPILSGGIDSMPWGNHDEAQDKWQNGFEQPYGRWEVRAKLPKGPGIWPGLWMLPMWSNPNPDPVENTGGKTNCGWPHNGEFDLLETWSDDPNVAHQGLIQGNCGKDIDARLGFKDDTMNLVNEFHTYGMQWEPNYLRFYIDDKITGTIFRGDKLKSKHRSGPNEGKKARPKEEAWIPSYPFYWILNLTIEGTKDGKLKPNYDTWTEKEVVIDFVKVYRHCTEEEFAEDEHRSISEKLCHRFSTDEIAADEYQSDNNETAKASMTAYPNPYKSGSGEIHLELRLFQDCSDVKIDLINIQGQILQSRLHDGPLQGDAEDLNAVHTFSFTPLGNLLPGVYLLRAQYSGCGANGSGRGNYVWKEVII